MFSHSAWHKKRFAENAEYREKIRAAWRRYRETHKDEINERRRLRRRTDSAFRDKERASKREWERRKRYREVYRISLDRLPCDADAAERRLRHLQAIRPGAVRRSLPCVRQGARAPVRQVQQRARVLRRQPRASAGGRGVPASVVRTGAGKFHDVGRGSRNRAIRTRVRTAVIVAAQAKPYESELT